MQMEANKIRQTYQGNINECMESLQYAIDKSFSNIDSQLDQILNDELNSFNITTSQLQSELPKVNPSYSLKQSYDDFQKQINQEVKSLIKTNLQKVFQKKEQHCQIQYKETQIKWEQKLIDKDFQNQQLKNQQTTQLSPTLIQSQSNLKSQTYQLIQQHSIKQDEYCYAIAFNKECSLLVAGCKSQIKVFEFKQGILKQVQLICEHVDSVKTLNFMKKSDHFISGSADKSIIIWTKNQHNQWIYQQKLNGHTGDIYCLVINNNEDLIITGSFDKTIKFWQKQNEWQCQQTITDHNDAVYGLSLNEQQNRMISCGRDKLILVIEKSELNKQYIVVQKISVEQYGLRLCFIEDNTFAFQPWMKDNMHVYEINIHTKSFIKAKDVPVKGGSDNCFFPQQYIKSKSILVNKNASNVNLIRIKQNNEFQIEQSIDFGTKLIFGQMTDDGQYLITWDDKSKEYQIRKYYEK